MCRGSSFKSLPLAGQDQPAQRARGILKAKRTTLLCQCGGRCPICHGIKGRVEQRSFQVSTLALDVSSSPTKQSILSLFGLNCIAHSRYKTTESVAHLAHSFRQRLDLLVRIERALGEKTVYHLRIFLATTLIADSFYLGVSVDS